MYSTNSSYLHKSGRGDNIPVFWNACLQHHAKMPSGGRSATATTARAIATSVFHRMRILDTCRKVASKTHLFFCLSSAPRKNSLPILKQSVARRLNSVNVHELPVGDLQKSDKQNTPVFLAVFSASPLRFDSHHRWSSRYDSTCILHRDHRADRGMAPERKSTHAHAQHTCFLPVFSAIRRCAAHDAAILHRALIHIIGGLLGTIARVSSIGITELIVGCRLKERAHMHMHNTPVFCLSSAPFRDALPMMRPSST